MNFVAQPVVLASSGMVRLGPLRLSAFGVCAAAGLMAAFALMRRTARMAHIDAEALWDAGLFAVMMAFVISRALLIVRDPHGFLAFPLIMLGLPSLTYGGIALTAVATLLYLRRKQLPLLAVLDAWSPCGALLAAALAVGHFFEGTDAGMPTTLPWGVRLAGTDVRLQPVQLFATVTSLVLMGVLLAMLPREVRSGVVAGVALAAAGAIAFLLDMISQPAAGSGAWLEPREYIALAALAGGMLLITRTKELA